MIRAPAGATDVKLDEHGYIDQDLSCAGCGYNLRGLLLHGLCPECATPAGRSPFSDQLRYCEPSQEEMFDSGMNAFVTGVITGRHDA